jgi:tRNA (adenine37-N6)-methyltransferase
MKLMYYVIMIPVFIMGLNLHSNADVYTLQAIGHVVKSDNMVGIKILAQYREALLGLDKFSHILVFYWFDQNDFPQKRSVLRVHPRGNKENPLTGVFATRSPFRPNLIGFAVCKTESIDDGMITVDDIDAFDGTPVVDLKPHMPRIDCIPDASVPDWAKRLNQDKSH